MSITPELKPLVAFRELPGIEFVPATAVPAPYRALLDHERDMTSTLEAFHKSPIQLRVLNSSRNHEHYMREVLLVSANTGRPVEYGAIRITLSAFNSEQQRMVLAERQPLGAILEAAAVPYTSRPGKFIRVKTDEAIQRTLGLSEAAILFGRCNRLSTNDGLTLAEIVEILPPVDIQ